MGVQEEEAAGDVESDQVALVVPSQVAFMVLCQRRAEITA